MKKKYKKLKRDFENMNLAEVLELNRAVLTEKERKRLRANKLVEFCADCGMSKIHKEKRMYSLIVSNVEVIIYC